MRPGRFFFLVDTVCYTRTDPCSSVCFPSSSIVRFLCVCVVVVTRSAHGASTQRLLLVCRAATHIRQPTHTDGKRSGNQKIGREKSGKKKAPRTRSMTSFCQPTTKESPSSSYGVAVGAGHLVCVCCSRGWADLSNRTQEAFPTRLEVSNAFSETRNARTKERKSSR